MPLAAVGYLDGTLAIYDLSTQTLRHQCQHQVLAAWSHGHGHGDGQAWLPSGPSLRPIIPPSLPPSMRAGSRCPSALPPLTPPPSRTLLQSGIVQLLWEAGTAVVYTCSLDGIVRLWDARTGHLLTDYRGHTAEILDFALSK